MLPLDTVRQHARNQGYQEVQFNSESRVIGFVRGEQRVNVYYTTGTVGTCLNHPSKGKTQLFRRNQTLTDLIRIFQDPRVHTGKGYYRRVSSSCPEPSFDQDLAGIWCCLQTQSLTNELIKYCDSDTVVIALGEGYVGVQEDGDCCWSNIPSTLHNKVHGRMGGQPERAAVDYVALGPDGYYFLQFKDGSTWCVGPPSLLDAVHEKDCGVELLAFAPNDGWFVQYDDGSNDWQGIPVGLHNQVNGRMTSMPQGSDAATVEHLAIGPNGEWFVRYANGAYVSAGLCTAMREAMHKLQSQGDDIASVAFGENYTWAIRY